MRPSPILKVVFSRSSLNADLTLEAPQAYNASLHSWLTFAAVVAEASSAAVIVRAHGNRVFTFADLATLVGEWMAAHGVDAVFATYEGALVSIACPRDEASARSRLRPVAQQRLGGRPEVA